MAKSGLRTGVKVLMMEEEKNRKWKTRNENMAPSLTVGAMEEYYRYILSLERVL